MLCDNRKLGCLGRDLINNLGVTWYSSTADYQGDRLLDINTVLDKGQAIAAIRQHFERIVAIGDGMNDVSMFEQSDIGIAFGAVHRPAAGLVQLADFVCNTEASLCMTLNQFLYT